MKEFHKGIAYWAVQTDPRMHYHWQKVSFFFFLFPMLFLKEQNNHFTNVSGLVLHLCVAIIENILFTLCSKQKYFTPDSGSAQIPWGTDSLQTAPRSFKHNSSSKITSLKHPISFDSVMQCTRQDIYRVKKSNIWLLTEQQNHYSSRQKKRKTITVHSRRKGVGPRYKLICPQESSHGRLSNRMGALPKRI